MLWPSSPGESPILVGDSSSHPTEVIFFDQVAHSKLLSAKNSVALSRKLPFMRAYWRLRVEVEEF